MLNSKIISSIFLLALSAFAAYPQMSKVPDSCRLTNCNVVPQDYGMEYEQINEPYRHIVATPILPDSADVRLHEHKAFWRA